jgi:hypothetical protein
MLQVNMGINARACGWPASGALQEERERQDSEREPHRHRSVELEIALVQEVLEALSEIHDDPALSSCVPLFS